MISSPINRAKKKHLNQFESEALFGATITRLLSPEQLSAVGFDHVRIAKGSALKSHVHASSESFIYVLEGSGIVTLEGKNYPVGAGDTLYIPAEVSHGFSTPDEDIVLLSVQSPPIYPENNLPDIQFSESSGTVPM